MKITTVGDIVNNKDSLRIVKLEIENASLTKNLEDELLAVTASKRLMRDVILTYHETWKNNKKLKAQLKETEKIIPKLYKRIFNLRKNLKNLCKKKLKKKKKQGTKDEK